MSKIHTFYIDFIQKKKMAIVKQYCCYEYYKFKLLIVHFMMIIDAEIKHFLQECSSIILTWSYMYLATIFYNKLLIAVIYN